MVRIVWVELSDCEGGVSRGSVSKAGVGVHLEGYDLVVSDDSILQLHGRSIPT